MPNTRSKRPEEDHSGEKHTEDSERPTKRAKIIPVTSSVDANEEDDEDESPPVEEIRASDLYLDTASYSKDYYNC